MAQSSIEFFGEEQAKIYDEKFIKMAPWREALQFTVSTLFSTLPQDAQLLVVGAGTGLEIEYLAQRYPGWKFTAVEPAPAMFAKLRERCERLGIAERCTLHEGFLESLPSSTPFDAATMLLVSQFLLDLDDRSSLFEEVAKRLKPQGRLVSADLAADLKTDQGQALMECWLEAMVWAGAPAGARPEMRLAYDRDVAVVAPATVSALIARSGFESPVPILQTLLIHAWLATKLS